MAMPISNGVTRSTLAGFAALILLSLSLAYGHDAAEWIQRGGFKNAGFGGFWARSDLIELSGHLGARCKAAGPGHIVAFASPSP